jgi:hypothetical protein
MSGALKAPNEKRPIFASHGKTEAIRLKGRRSEILSGHEGLAPVRYSQGSKPDRALFKRTHSCRTSDELACLFPWGPWVPGLCDPGIAPMDATVPLVPALAARAAAKSGGNGVQPSHKDAIRDRKWRYPFTCSRRPEE